MILKEYDLKKQGWDNLLKELKDRENNNDLEITNTVLQVLEDVKKDGDKALKKYTEKFDKIEVKNMEVTDAEIENCFSFVEKEFIENMKEAKENIEFYHNAQKSRGFILNKDCGVFLGQRVLPLDSVGVYVPGGTAAYPSSVLMNVIPAKVAGVSNIVMVTPPGKDGKINPYIGVAAKIAGIDKI